ncbi:hypothetical protein B566_EDAN009872 [Ephemera danica]|nr:hypothetical protein B566_EDAN009872 [Ephemera danica]
MIQIAGPAPYWLFTVLWSRGRAEPGFVEARSPGLCALEQSRGLLPGFQHARCAHPSSHGAIRSRLRQGKNCLEYLTQISSLKNSLFYCCNEKKRSNVAPSFVMIYLIEGVLPESYFANNLRGLSVDMAVFRELLRMRLPSLSKHLEQLQSEAGDLATVPHENCDVSIDDVLGTSYEPPLTNVFTMQWFLTLFANCLPQVTVLRVWDLVFLEGNEVLLRAALAIWASLEDRIMAVESADEFYSIMGVLTREMLEFGLMDPNNLVKIFTNMIGAMVTVAPFPFPELPELRDRYTYNITPWSHSVSNAARRGLRLFQSDDDEPDDEDPADDEKMAVAAAFGISAVFRSPRRRSSLPLGNAAGHGPDKDRLNLDISALKQQYSKLRERQRQAHIILSDGSNE